jgi:pimeloyl-ACP methyl ester carboxylesterase
MIEVFEDTGHVPQLEHPERFVAAVERWLKHVGEALYAPARAS